MKSLKKSFKETAFVRGASRDQMQNGLELDLELEQYLKIGL